ncbi:uncharacterized protein LOC118421593 [Branchiostoma floridae]|uniref:Uncharacterized protein LOC118421593 n=1 Tax=Branchiostoma floridae TaxID=7739 RepID=A0A9J7LN93_BRAFL|nr:uncharacterized protein LOC118421593 [Branchiostoma floridae]
MAEKFLQLDRRLNTYCDNDSLMMEYTKLMIEGIVNDDDILEVEAIKSIGDVYLKRGTETRQTPCLTKASALYNTALARCEQFQGTVVLIHRLLYTARVRQEMNRSRNKDPMNVRLRLQQQSYYRSRDFSVRSPTTDVIGDTKGQQFMLPSNYISSQTPKHVPDYRTYEEHLTTGDRALTDGNLDLAEQKFAAALKIIHDPNKPDRCREAECLCRLGDVYVRLGKRTKEGKKFTQAAALYNAAMARTDKIKDCVTKRLQETEKWLLQYTANANSKSIPSDQAVRHKKRLGDSRSRAKSQLEAIDQQHNPYQYDEDEPKMKTVEAERAEAVKALFKTIAKNRQSFIQDLVKECIETLGPPPCKYAFIGLGSQATELVTPYSDLEFAILIEEGKDNDDTRRYFINLTHYLHLKVINLGETILPAMAIPSLNDFQSEYPEKDWFFDSVTPRGFAFDGFMPWASKTPFGREKTKSKPPVSLIQTPANMAKFQHLDISVSEGYHLSDILRRSVFLAGDEALVNEYVKKLLEVITDDRLSHFQSRLSFLQIISENRDQFSNYEPTGQLLNVKKDIYRFPGIAIELLALWCRVTLSSAWDVIEKMKEMENIEEENGTHLAVLTSISAELRLRTYVANGGQKDSLSPLAEMKAQAETQEVFDSMLRSVFYIPDTKVLFRYYCRAIPLKRCIAAMVQDSAHVKSSQVLKTTIFDTSNECLGFIANNLLLSNISISYLEAALTDAGSDAVKQSKMLDEIGNHWLRHSDISKAKFYFEQSLKLRHSIYGETTAHSDIAQSLQNLGISWSDFGEHKKAISYYERSLKMMKTIYRDSIAHPDLARLLLNLGSSWMKLGDQKKAINCFEKSLTMMKTIYGDNTAHKHIAGVLMNLGSSWGDLGDFVKRISYYQQSLTMLKTIYGDNTAHPDIAAALLNMGSSWIILGDQKKTVTYLEQSLTMMKTIYGENTAHQGIAAALQGLGASWIKLGDFKKAISYFQQSLTMKKTIYGDNTAHQDVAGLLINLGLSWSDLGDQTKAISYYEQSLSIHKTVYGDKAHPDIAAALLNMGLSLHKLGEQIKAISYFEQSLKMAKTIYGDNTAHSSIAAALHNIGLSWTALGVYFKAVPYYEESLMMEKALHGDNTAHPDIAQSLHNLGICWRELGCQERAISYYEQAYTMRKTFYGENLAHPEIAQSLHHLGFSWSKFGDHKKAISYFLQSLRMKKAIYGDIASNPDNDHLLTNLGISLGHQLADPEIANSDIEQIIAIL